MVRGALLATAYCSIWPGHFRLELCGSRWLFQMQYRGTTYTIVQSARTGSWKWAVHLDEKTTEAGESPTREAAITSVRWAINKALASKKHKTTPRRGNAHKPKSPIDSA